ncbi:hypothetical protein F2P56_020815 [Juglans regia]|uniref:Early nodulin-like protein 2 n=2 Tax=Juglans regia TaxID=51240 RepID=A0A2I4DK80_JUGRE|nr:early nodulin-like protein 2 [Juglans regia]KAF5460984.1 hypothetical protein F2P56_020815 [Juglans regia]
MEFQRHISLFIVLFSCFLYLSEAYKFYVGGRDGWVSYPSESYSHWTGRNRFKVDDKLVFKYKKGTDSVLVVNKDDYDKCNTKNPIKKLEDGDSEFNLDRSGPFFFISGNEQNCEKGQKLIVTVLSVRHNNKYPPPSSPTPLPTPKGAPAPGTQTPVSPKASPPAPALAPKSSAPVAKPPANSHFGPAFSPRSPAHGSSAPTTSPVSAPFPSPKAPAPGTQAPVSPKAPTLAPALAPKNSAGPALAPKSSSTPMSNAPETTPVSAPWSYYGPVPAVSPPSTSTSPESAAPVSPSSLAPSPEANTPSTAPSSTSPASTPESTPTSSPPELSASTPSTEPTTSPPDAAGIPSGSLNAPTAPRSFACAVIAPTITNVLAGTVTLALSMALRGALGGV